MKRASIIAVVIALLVAAEWAACAQDDSRKALASELMTVLKVKENIERSLAMMNQMIVSQIQQLAPPGTSNAEQSEMKNRMSKVIELVAQELSWDKMKNEQIALYAETFTEPQLKDLVAFYKTPSGQAYIEKQPELMKRSMEITQKMLNQVIPKIQAMADELKKGGDQPPPALQEKK
jgi:uncharacterized protein